MEICEIRPDHACGSIRRVIEVPVLSAAIRAIDVPLSFRDLQFRVLIEKSGFARHNNV